jgi:Xaa-Pro dipeptidase
MVEVKTTLIDYQLSELKGLPNEYFTKNRQNYLTNLKRMITGMEPNSILILQGGNEIPRFDTDVLDYHFQQEGNFYYLSGVVEPKFYAILDLSSGAFTLFYDLDKDERSNIFMKIPTLEDIYKKYNLPVIEIDDLYTEIKKRDPLKIYVLNGENTDSERKIKTAILNFPPGYEKYENMVDANPYIYEILADTRTRKTEEEISLLRFINKITIEAHIKAYSIVQPDINERDVENIFFNYLRKKYYARIWSYPMICGCGNNSSTLHYDQNTKVLKSGDLMLMDMGVRFAGYTSDITSTIPVNGKFTKEQGEIYEIVLSANREVIKYLKPGVYWPDMHILAERKILDGLIKLGILNYGKIEEMINDRVAYYFMPHGLGHFMGIDVHDVGGYLSFTPQRSDQVGLRNLRTSRYLAPNNVITVEPGIYFIPFLLDMALNDDKLKKYFNEKVKIYYNFGGIRIEDDVLITMDGCENLTAGLPRQIHEIENLMKNNS